MKIKFNFKYLKFLIIQENADLNQISLQMSEYNKKEEIKIKKTWNTILTKVQNKLDEDKNQHESRKRFFFDFSAFFS